MESTKMCMLVLAAALCLCNSAMGAFDRIGQCPGRQAGCHCEPQYIECLNRSLNKIPPFEHKTWVFNSVQLGFNTITNIPRNIFSNLNVTEIYLNNNNISNIETDAFGGLKDQLKVLDLAYNKLRSLSDEFGELSKLQVLDVSYNPIKALGFRDPVMRKLGDFLIDFRFGDKELDIWPDSLHHFQALEKLKFYGGGKDMDNIPIDAFHSFEFTLRELWIQNTGLLSTPIALQYLKSIGELHFDNNPGVGDAGILIPAFAGMTRTLRNLTLKNNNLTTFPPVLVTLTHLNNLSLASNSLEFVSDQAVIRVVSDLRTLDLTNCDLDRIPGALSKLQNLTNLNLSNNHLTTIEKNDLQHMVNLKMLDVSNNPLQYISKSTFYDLRKIERLIMRETNLLEIPEALKNIPTLLNFDLTSSTPSIDCTCDLLWLYCYRKNNNTNLDIKGQCETVLMDIMNYVNIKVKEECFPSC